MSLSSKASSWAGASAPHQGARKSRTRSTSSAISRSATSTPAFTREWRLSASASWRQCCRKISGSTLGHSGSKPSFAAASCFNACSLEMSALILSSSARIPPACAARSLCSTMALWRLPISVRRYSCTAAAFQSGGPARPVRMKRCFSSSAYPPAPVRRRRNIRPSAVAPIAANAAARAGRACCSHASTAAKPLAARAVQRAMRNRRAGGAGLNPVSTAVAASHSRRTLSAS